MKAFFLAWILGVAAARAQPPRVINLVSPEVISDRRVTFRINAPSASAVSLFGDWMPPNTQQPMTRDERGVWSITVGPLDPGLAIYTFTTDGVTTPDPVNPRIKLRARTSASLVDVPGTPPEQWQVRDVPHGAIEVNWAQSRVIGDTRAYYVYTPPGYDPRHSQRYPVLYLLHGSNDTAAGWTDVGKANFILDSLLAEKRAVPMLIVMPWGHAVPFEGPQTDNTVIFERYLIDEIIPQVERKYRTLRDRRHRALIGLSMGGGQALEIGFRHMELFSALGAFSFAVPADFEPHFQDPLSHPMLTNARLNLLWLGCGRQDPAFERNQRFSELLARHQIRYIFRPTDGRHNFAIWRQYLTEVAPLLFQARSQPQ